MSTFKEESLATAAQATAAQATATQVTDEEATVAEKAIAMQDEEGTEEKQSAKKEEREAVQKPLLDMRKLEEKLHVLKNKKKAALSAVTKSQNKVKEHMTEHDNLHKVKSMFYIHNEKFSTYHDCYIALLALLTDEDIEKEEKKYLVEQTANAQLQEEVESWIANAERELTEQLSIKSMKSRSTSSKSSRSHSSRSSRSSQAHEKAKLAELLVEKKMLGAKQEQKRKQEQILLDIEIEKAKARNQVYEAIYESNKESTENTERKQKTTMPQVEAVYHGQELNPEAIPFEPVIPPAPPPQQQQQQHQQSAMSTADMLPQVSQMFLPSPEVPKFTGDPINYKSFTMAFDARILPHVSNELNKLYYLDQQLQGEPKNLISGCLFMSPEIGYSEARKLLDREYGDPFKVATAYTNKLAEWPNIRTDDGNQLKQLSFFLTKCSNVMQNVSHMTVLNHALNMQMIVKKLPGYLQNKWRDRVPRLRRTGEISFQDLVKFVKEAVDSATDPVFGKSASDQSNPRIQKHSNVSFATNVDTHPTMRPCLMCSQNHDLDDCATYKQETLPDRRNFLKIKRACFSCYGYNHISKNCTAKRICEICQKRHPTGLHDPNFRPIYGNDGKGQASTLSAHRPQHVYQTVSQAEPQTALNIDASRAPSRPSTERVKKSHAPPSVTANSQVDKGDEKSSTQPPELSSTCCALNSSSMKILQAILPVRITCQKSGMTMDTYALYDNGSSGCFITDNLKEKLNASGTATDLVLQTMHGNERITTEAVTDLMVSDMKDENALQLPKVFTRQEIPVSHDQIPKREELQSCPNLQYVIDVLPKYYPDMEIGLLIGSNCPRALEPLQVIPTEGEGPFAVRYRHGWTLNGPIEAEYSPANKIVQCNKIMFRDVTKVKECDHHKEVISMFESDFNIDLGDVPDRKGLSQEDHKFIEIVNQQHKFQEGHHVLPLPFREIQPSVTNNRNQAESRLQWQKKKMQRDEKYKQDYTKFMDKLITKGYAVKVPEDELHSKPETHYLLHHGVYHPQKNKIRVVFDGSAKYNGSALNDHLLQGPDLTNSLVGVLTRFRQERIATISDIESMFYQVKVPRHQQDYLRFLWWTDGDVCNEPDEYRMTVHIFGAVSSPSIANCALHMTADSIEDANTEAAKAIRRNFYVDDCLLSVEDEDKAISLVKSVTEGCASGGFRLTKFISNSKEVLASIPESETSITVQDLDLQKEDTTLQRALGIQWKIDDDKFRYAINKPNKPHTRRGLLSIVSSLYDPLGFLAPYILPAKKLLQELCADEKLGWDDEISDDQERRWKKWLSGLDVLNNMAIDRCVKPKDFGNIVKAEIHVFSDASTIGYGSVAYLRIVNEMGRIHVAFLLGKARLAPIKPISIPRLELTAAKVSVQIGQFLKRELDMNIHEVTYHTDSTTVLNYLNNAKKRFPIYVANRVKAILDFTTVAQWRYVDTKNNPADHASRGMTIEELLSDNKWLQGPDFLKCEEEQWPQQPGRLEEIIPPNMHVEEIQATATLVDDTANATHVLINHYSSWFRLKRAVAIYARFFNFLKYKVQKQSKMKYEKLNAIELKMAELAVIRYVQKEAFQKEIELKRGRESKPLPMNSPIYKLDPHWDEESDVLRVGGRLRRAEIDHEAKYPILLPKHNHVTDIIVREIHNDLGHAGRNHVLSALRERYWVINSNSAVRSILFKCVTCRRIRGSPYTQKMADFPKERVNPSSPFTHTGVDYFGPFTIRDGRKYVKRYGVIFTCLSSRAIHIEVANSLETDSFLNALRRFIARRGNVRTLKSDNGTNFVGADRELKRCIKEMSEDKITAYLSRHEIEWSFNPPGASHMGGVWERQIRTVRRVLAGMNHPIENLNEETFQTLMCEIESIVNCRPLTTLTDDPDDLTPLCPAMILTGKKELNVPPPGNFQENDLYSRKRWRRVQHLANVFWNRWKREFLVTLQRRNKWTKQNRNAETGDIVLLIDETRPRSEWVMGKIVNVEKDSECMVRTVVVKTQNTEYRRPVSKVVLLVEAE